MKQTRYITYAVCGLLIALLAVAPSAAFLEDALRLVARFLAAYDYLGKDAMAVEEALSDAVDNHVLSNQQCRQLLFVLAQRCKASEGFRGRLPAIIELLKMGKVAQNQWGFPVAELLKKLVIPEKHQNGHTCEGKEDCLSGYCNPDTNTCQTAPPSGGGGGASCHGGGLCAGISAKAACLFAGCTWY